MSKDKNVKLSFTQNRELSWLKFNERVLEECEDEKVPELEKLMFNSIFISNLDEFFMIRVGSLYDLEMMDNHAVDNKTGMTPKEQLDKIYEQVKPLYEKKDAAFLKIEKSLRTYGIYSLSFKELNGDETKYVKEYFKSQIMPILSPQIVDSRHPFPHLYNKVVHIVTTLKNKSDVLFGIVPIPSILPDVVFMPGSDIRYISIEKIIIEYAEEIFDMYNVIEKNYICVTRNADISADDEAFDIDEDFRYMMKKMLSQREKMAVVRVEAAKSMSKKMEEFFLKKFKIEKNQIFYTKTPMKIGYISEIKNRLSLAQKMKLTYPQFLPAKNNMLLSSKEILNAIKEKDMLLAYPFESMKPFLNMVKEAANDPMVISIKICIYRLSKKSRLIEYLCQAAENGKDVTVLIELRARFDEQNNIDWSERLEESGCRIIYGFEEYKVHSKICLVTRKEGENIKYFTHISTGNFNEKTAEMYTDLALLTCNEKIGMDAVKFFKNMAVANLKGSYDYLLVSPYELKEKVIYLIMKECEKKEKGRIIIKMNSLTDLDIIKALSKASCEGVKIDLILRGICCIVPGVKDATENIRVTSIVGRFLEHSRIYSFGEGTEQKIYISSADFMTRNTEKRVEIACPIVYEPLKEKINHMVEVMLKDNVKARELKNDGNYYKKETGENRVNSQEIFMKEAPKNDKIDFICFKENNKEDIYLTKTV